MEVKLLPLTHLSLECSVLSLILSPSPRGRPCGVLKLHALELIELCFTLLRMKNRNGVLASPSRISSSLKTQQVPEARQTHCPQPAPVGQIVRTLSPSYKHIVLSFKRIFENSHRWLI